MNPQIKQQWLTALRSGEYSETKGWIRNNDGYDPWGVLCDLHDKVRTSKNSGWELYYHKFIYLSEKYGVPTEIFRWAGLEEGLMVVVDKKYELISYLVDKRGYTHKQIADLIEEQL